jgi:hypothetical protein
MKYENYLLTKIWLCFAAIMTVTFLLQKAGALATDFYSRPFSWLMIIGISVIIPIYTSKD